MPPHRSNGPRKYRRRLSILAAIATAFLTAPATRAVEPSGVSCISPLGSPTETGALEDLHAFPGVGVLVRAEKGLFLSRTTTGPISLTLVAPSGPGRMFNIKEFPGVGMLVGTETGLFLLRDTHGHVTWERLGDTEVPIVTHMVGFPGVGIILTSENAKGSLAHAVNGKVIVEATENAGLGSVSAAAQFPGVGVLIRSAGGDWLLARAVDGRVRLVPAAEAGLGEVVTVGELPGARLFIQTRTGWSLARFANGKIEVRAGGLAAMGNAQWEVRTFNDGGMVLRAPNGWFFPGESNGQLTWVRLDTIEMGQVTTVHAFGAGALIAAANGLFFAQMANGTVSSVERLAVANMGPLEDIQAFPGVGLLIRAQNAWFTARIVGGKVAVDPFGEPFMGDVLDVVSIPSVDELVRAENGWFLVHVTKGKISFEPAGDTKTGKVLKVDPFPQTGLFLSTQNGLFVATQAPLQAAQVVLTNRPALNGSPADTKLDRNFDFTITHPCGSTLRELGLTAKVTRPGGAAALVDDEQISRIQPEAGRAEVTLRMLIDAPGRWQIQFLSIQAGVERKIGAAQEVSFEAETLQARLERLLWWLVHIGLALLVLVNVALFFAARRSAWAWRVVTDDTLSTFFFRIATLLLRHTSWAQLWMLDLYFQNRKAAIGPPAPYLPVPLDRGDGKLKQSDEITGPPWDGRRLWIQGNSGMGKTALYNHVVEMAFRDCASSFAAFAKWRCVIVAFPVRARADRDEDKYDPAWVIQGIKSALAESNLTFADEKLLQSFLHSGTIAVAIDGVHEASRTRAVESFAAAFAAPPILVTSQEAGGVPFANWSLPTDMREFTADLLRLHLSDADAQTVLARIMGSDLKDVIRSGYDVRLVIELARRDPRNALLPSSRVGLYTAVVNEAWPTAPPEVIRDQQERIEATAWKMVSKREAHEHKSRLEPGSDLEEDLLTALADAPERYGKSVRLIHRAPGGAFEFVHEQMHAFLAARYFARDGSTVTRLEKLVAESTIWTQPLLARHTLWSFAVALLDDNRLLALWERVDDQEEWDALRRELKAEARRRGLDSATPQLC